MDAESARLQEDTREIAPWKWGPYLSERQWGTVREDYSGDGSAWDYFTHDQARSRAYRWGEDGLAGISDDRQLLCFALSLWNGRDPILKERLFGLANSEGNHGEDCKEYYFYLDCTPTHSYMKYLYKYPQAAYPYVDLVETNRRRSRSEPEYELLDTGVFEEDRYFDVFVEYAKESPEDILIQITVNNRGPERASLWLLPTLWFRNTWSWGERELKPLLRVGHTTASVSTIVSGHPDLGTRFLYCDQAPPILVTENETNTERIQGIPNGTRYVKDGINRCIVDSVADAVNPSGEGTKAAANYELSIAARGETTIRLRLSLTSPAGLTSTYPDGDPFGSHFREVMQMRRDEADAFYASIIPTPLSPEERNIARQALAGMLWSKQYYEYDVEAWLRQHGSGPHSERPRQMRNSEWFHMVNSDIISMPDKWEYPWYAAWDLAFHTLALSMVDQRFAQDQLELMLRERYLHPNGQVPAYEWNFGDANPPVHAWACMFNHRILQAQQGQGDEEFLRRAFQKLLMNFTWWVNRKDRDGSNVFEGGFLGLDNISVFDRSSPLPTGGYLEQADGTAWMALFCQNMLEMALELAPADSLYEDLACKFLEHFLWIASAINRSGMWDEEDGFYYDSLRLPDGRSEPIRLRSMVGLLPLCASTVFEPVHDRLPAFNARAAWFAQHHPELFVDIHRPGLTGAHGRHLLSLVTEAKLRRILARMLDENEFLSDFGIRSISRYHVDHPYKFTSGGREYCVDYEPAESSTGLFGGNSNWRGPIWMPVNTVLVRGLLQMYRYYGNEFTVECPTGSGRMMNLFEISQEISKRLTRLFTRDEQGNRPVYGGTDKFQHDPHWRDYILFYEYFHGDNGAGIGASHQTGWTGVIARILQLNATLNADKYLKDQPMSALAVERKRTAAALGSQRLSQLKNSPGN